jgi:hypothetical protein
MPASPLVSVQCCRRQVCQRAMWPLLVVILPPFFDFPLCIVKAGEPVGIQAFISQPPVKAFHVRILHRLTWLNELQSHPTFFAPGGQSSTAKLRLVIQNNASNLVPPRPDPAVGPPVGRPGGVDRLLRASASGFLFPAASASSPLHCPSLRTSPFSGSRSVLRSRADDIVPTSPSRLRLASKSR